MKIGEYVKQHIKNIFEYCNNSNHNEIYLLLSPEYSKDTFKLSGYPFCKVSEKIEPSESKRYWTEVYVVRGKEVRVTSQWTAKMKESFIDYLHLKGISSEINLSDNQKQVLSNQKNSRYRGNHIGNAQNLFIRNILSNLGTDSFNEGDWEKTKEEFDYKCAYCGTKEEPLIMEHAVPINKEKLGEHRLGNLVPSCKSCNSKKGNQNFREFLSDNTIAISIIKKYMDKHNYVPLDDEEQIKMVLNKAHEEISALADRYITIINKLV